MKYVELSRVRGGSLIQSSRHPEAPSRLPIGRGVEAPNPVVSSPYGFPQTRRAERVVAMTIGMSSLILVYVLI